MNKKFLGFDYLKFFCSIAIIFLHINPFQKSGQLYYISKAIGHLGVPCFFIISGFLFFRKLFILPENERKGLYIHYIKRLLLLLGFWLIVYFVVYDFWWIINGDFLLNIIEYIKHILFGGSGFFLWYIVSLIVGISICYFLYTIMGKSLLIFAAVFFIIGTIPLSYNFLIKNTFIESIYLWYNKYFYTVRNGLFFAFPCISLGMIIADKESFFEKNKLFSILFFIISFIIFVFECVMVKILQENALISPLQISVILFSFGLTLAFFHIRGENKVAFLFRKLSFLIYVIHPLLIYLINILINLPLAQRVGIDYYWYLFYYLQIPVIAISSIIIGWILIKLSKKIKFLEKVM